MPCSLPLLGYALRANPTYKSSPHDFRRRPFHLAAGDARLRRLAVVDHGLGHTTLELRDGKPAHIEHRPDLAAVLQHHAGIHAAASADQARAGARAELVGRQRRAIDLERRTPRRIGHRHRPMPRAEAALAAAHLQLRRRLGRMQRPADRAAVAGAL